MIAPKNLTIKQEAFAAEYVSNGNASEAYRRAYNANAMKPSTVHVRAHELVTHSKVAARVAELKAQISAENEITFAEVTSSLRRAAEGAAAAGQWGAAVGANMALAKLGGLIIEKRQMQAEPSQGHLEALKGLSNYPSL
jgi:phage terminase small subunit